VKGGRLRPSLGYAGFLLVGAIVGLASMSLVPASPRWIGPARVAVEAGIAAGRTDLRLPPLGTVSAKTHLPPVLITVTLVDVDPTALGQTLFKGEGSQELIAQAEEGLRKSAITLALRLVLAGLLLGAVAAALLPRRRISGIVAGAAGGLLGVFAMLAFTAVTFNVGAFGQPRFSGALERAPEVIQAVQKRAGSIGKLDSRFEQAAARLSHVMALLSEPLEDPHLGAVAILHVSDIHSNPLGTELTKQLARQFRVDAILDTGDLTSFGEPIEARIGELLAGMPVPYLFVPGNHDSPAVREALAGIATVRVLNRESETVRGVKILGWADPAFTASSKVSTKDHNRAVRAMSERVALAVEEQKPDILAVHHPALAREAWGEVPLVLAGHRHRQQATEHQGTVVLEVGSTGATGLGSFLVESDLPYEAEVIYLRDSRPVAYDYIRFRGLGSEFEIRRFTLSRLVYADSG
jgi:predicted MPP superfamily phosphohydrolase